MANSLSKTGITTGDTVRAWHVTQSVDAFTGDSAYDITISGSLTVTGSTNIQGNITAVSLSGDGSGITGVTGEWDGSHLGDASITGSLTLSGSNSELYINQLQISSSGDTFHFRDNTNPGDPVVTLDGGNIRLGVGTDTPTEALDVVGNVYASGNISSSATVSGNAGSFSIINTQELQFDTAYSASGHTTGRMYWSDDNKTVNLEMQGSDVVLQLGQEEHIYAKNTSGVTINNGDAVRISGAQGANVTITKAVSGIRSFKDAIEQDQILGLATEQIADNQSGYVTTFGSVRDLDTSAFSEGDILYLSHLTSGSYTNVRPPAPCFEARVGIVQISNPTDGVILVNRLEPTFFSDISQVTSSGVIPNEKTYLVYDDSTDLISFTNEFSGSFSGSFQGDGSQLTGISGGGSAFPFTGSANISGSLTITGSSISNQTTIYDFLTLTLSSGNDQLLMDPSNGIQIADPDGNDAIGVWDRSLYDPSGNESANWDSRQLIKSNGDITADWENQTFSGSFSGSFQGDGSQLTGLPADSNFATTNLTFTGARDHNTNGNYYYIDTDGGGATGGWQYIQASRHEIGKDKSWARFNGTSMNLFGSGSSGGGRLDVNGSGVTVVTGHFTATDITASGNISSSSTISGITGSFSHMVGNSPITFGSPQTSVLNGTSIVEVTSSNQFPSPLPANTTYIVRGEIQTTTPLTASNDNIAIRGFDRNKDKLIYTGTGPFITTVDSNFSLSDIQLQSSGSILSGSNINLNDHTNNYNRVKVLEIRNCEIRNTNDVWKISGYELVDISNTLMWYITGSNGCQFQSNRHMEITSCEMFNWYDEPIGTTYSPASMIHILPNLEDSGSNAIGNAVVNINSSIIHPEVSQSGLFIDTSSTTRFGTLASNTFIDVGLGASGALIGGSNYNSGSMLNYDVGLNQGILNSTSGVVMTVTGNTTNTTLTAATPTNIDTGGLATERASVRYTVSGSGRCTYNGTKTTYVSIHADIAYQKQGSGTDSYVFYLYKNGVELPGSESDILSGGATTDGTISLTYGNLISENDYIEIYVENPSSADDILIKSAQLLIRE